MLRLVFVLLLAALGYWFFLRPERVDAVYYPDKHNLLTYSRLDDVKSLEGCRAAIAFAAANKGDLVTYSGHGPVILRNGDYECGVGFMETLAKDLRVYRETVR
jgi:hypothetical protein